MGGGAERETTRLELTLVVSGPCELELWAACCEDRPPWEHCKHQLIAWAAIVIWQWLGTMQHCKRKAQTKKNFIAYNKTQGEYQHCQNT